MLVQSEEIGSAIADSLDIIKEYSRFSGLGLNIKKTAIPRPFQFLQDLFEEVARGGDVLARILSLQPQQAHIKTKQ